MSNGRRHRRGIERRPRPPTIADLFDQHGQVEAFYLVTWHRDGGCPYCDEGG